MTDNSDNPTNPASGGSPRTLRRSPEHRMVAGVAAGVADWLDVDVTAVRAGFAVLALAGGLGLPLYLAGWLLLPEEGSEQSMAEELLHRGGLV